ncbi:MAG: sigma-E processing peptidase SpoIIGA [Acutalibacteraceae bacterium]|jgi:stage II sporulation protein GA (sporulation sigma-E factor processing peptidase)
MKQTIYVDVLISVNLFINYFLLLSVAKILNLKTIKKRLILSAFVGAMYSLIILLPPMNGIFSLVIKLFMSASIVVLAFKWVNRWLFFKIIITFYGINFLFGGIIFCLWYFVMPNAIFVNNNMIYLNLSPLFLVVATFLAYLAIRLMNKITGCQNHLNLDYDILVKFNEKTLTLKAKVDTGNTLREPFSGLPVIVAQYKFIENMVPQPIKEYFCALNKSDSDKDFLYNTQKFKNFRLIPYKTISGTGILPAFKPTYIKILSKNQNIKKEAYIAVCGEKIFNEEFQALINYELIE